MKKFEKRAYGNGRRVFIDIQIRCFFLIFLILSSCSEKKESILDLFNQITVLRGDTLPFQPFLGQPFQVLKTDSFFLVRDQYENHSITVINQFTGESKRTLRHGSGPNEVVQPVLFSQLINDSILNIFERNTSTIIQFRLEDILFENNPTVIKKTKLDGFVGLIQEAKDFYVALGPFEKGMFGIFNKDGQKRHEYISYLNEDGKFSEPFFRFYVYQSDIKLSSDGRKLVQAGLYYDLLCFYRIDKDNISVHRKYFFNDANVDGTRSRLILLPNTKLCFYSLYPTENKVYALYSGDEHGNRNQTRSFYLLCFDWDGNPLKAYKFDRSLLSIWVNKSDTELFGLCMEDEPKILCYKL